MDSVSTRKGGNDNVPTVRTEPHDCRADDDRCDSNESAHIRAVLHEPLAHPPNASGCGENLDRHWLVANRAGVDRPATWCALARHLEHLENRGPALRILAYPPEDATCAYLGPDGKRLARRSPLDVAVWETKNQDRRVGHARTVPGPADDRLLRFPRIDTLNVYDLVRDSSHHPEHALPANGLAHRISGLSGEVVRDVAVRELDHNRLCVQGAHALQIPDSLRRKPAPSNPLLDKPLTHPPLVFDESGVALSSAGESVRTS